MDPLTYAASRYNRGSVYSGPYHYTDRGNAYARAWALLETPAAPAPADPPAATPEATAPLSDADIDRIVERVLRSLVDRLQRTIGA